MPQGFGTLLALVLLIGGSIWYFNRTPASPPPLPLCDDAQQTGALIADLARPETTIIHETREANIAAAMSLKQIVEIEQDESAAARSRLCDALLAITPRGPSPGNAYALRYAITRSDDGGVRSVPVIGDIRRTQLPPCDTPGLFDGAARMMLGLRENSDLTFIDLRETEFDTAAQKRRCFGKVRAAADSFAKETPFRAGIAWGDRSTGQLMVDIRSAD